jgi:hypothetical protein
MRYLCQPLIYVNTGFVILTYFRRNPMKSNGERDGKEMIC